MSSDGISLPCDISEPYIRTLDITDFASGYIALFKEETELK